MIPKTSERHLIGFPIGVMFYLTMDIFKFPIWTNTSFQDETLGIYLPPFVFQWIATTFLAWWVAVLFEYLQQKRAKKIAKELGKTYTAPSSEDTKMDILVSTVSFSAGIIVGGLIILLLNFLIK
jgi:hypothetical protein